MHPCVVEEYDEQQIVLVIEGDWGENERLIIQHGEHIEEHESIEEDDMHSVHEVSFMES